MTDVTMATTAESPSTGTSEAVSSAYDGVVSAPPQEVAVAADPQSSPKIHDWVSKLEGLDDDIKNSATINKYSNPSELAKAYYNLSKKFGSEKIAIPKKDATPSEWKEVFERLGNPADRKDYKVQIDSRIPMESGKEDPLMVKALDVAHENGILPHQAEKLINTILEGSFETTAKQREMYNTQRREELNQLYQEWGGAKDFKLTQGRLFIERFGGADFMNYVNKSGLGSDVRFMKFIDGLVTKSQGDKYVLGDGSGGTVPMTPDQIQAEIGRVYSHPAFKQRGHPEHKSLLSKLENLNKQLTGGR